MQCRDSDGSTLNLLAAMDDVPTHKAVLAERSFLAGLGGGCTVPVAAFAEATNANEVISLRGLVASADGKQVIRVSGAGNDAQELGHRVAREALAHGAGEILALGPVQ